MRSNLFSRHVFSCLSLVLMIAAVFGWWRSTRSWTAFDVETPAGILKLQSESSIFGIGAQFMLHEHRWMAFKNSDAITGDRMRFLMQWPQLRMGGGLFLVILPYWQLTALLLVTTVAIFARERSRARRYKK